MQKARLDSTLAAIGLALDLPALMNGNPKMPTQDKLLSSFDVNVESSPAHFEVTLAADIHAISPVVQWVMRLVGDMDFARGKEFEVELALREALANAIKHGCKGDPAKKIEFSVTEEVGRGILIVVRDPGQGFNPGAVPNPAEQESSISDHGRGIFLIRRLMDEVQYERNGSEIRMRKYR